MDMKNQKNTNKDPLMKFYNVDRQMNDHAKKCYAVHIVINLLHYMNAVSFTTYDVSSEQS